MFIVITKGDYKVLVDFTAKIITVTSIIKDFIIIQEDINITMN
jgi:hypothetical protein